MWMPVFTFSFIHVQERLCYGPLLRTFGDPTMRVGTEYYILIWKDCDNRTVIIDCLIFFFFCIFVDPIVVSRKRGKRIQPVDDVSSKGFKLRVWSGKILSLWSAVLRSNAFVWILRFFDQNSVQGYTVILTRQNQVCDCPFCSIYVIYNDINSFSIHLNNPLYDLQCLWW